MGRSIEFKPRNKKLPVATMLTKERWELYKEVFAKTAEKYGRFSKAFNTITKGIDVNVKGSQFFWANNLNFYLPKNQKIISLEDAEDINDTDKTFFAGCMLEFPEVILRTEEPLLEQDEYILNDLVKQVKREGFKFYPGYPLRISGLEFVKNNSLKNQYGLLLKIGKDTKIVNDERFSHLNNEKHIQFGKGRKKIYTREKGLSKIYFDFYNNLNSEEGINSPLEKGVVVIKTIPHSSRNKKSK